ncbi:MAG TPA: HD domain-containing phosphohydrolase [Terriglobia bacterium]|nr:HD domain-containing phosphohydrolase [Terriglobia bacterium]
MPATILVVDDEPANRYLMEALLEPQGYTVLTAEDGEGALESFSKHQPDLLLLDIMMPKLDGIEVCRRLKANPETRLTPVVLVSALAALDDRVRGLEAGADDFLTKPIERIELMARVRALLKLKAHTDELERAEMVLFALAQSIEGKDSYTGGHCERLSNYSERLGRRIGLPEDQITALRRGGIVHDIGKVAVPDAILLKPGKLTDEEWKIMRQHPLVGERICSPLKSFRLVLPIIRHHHEKLDGSGYPDGLKGELIPVTSRIMTLADVYDALTTERPYKAPLSNPDALDIMGTEVEKGWWDPQLYSEFRAMIMNEEEKKQG